MDVRERSFVPSASSAAEDNGCLPTRTHDDVGRQEA